METVAVHQLDGTYTIYSNDGRCVGSVCEPTGRAMIGNHFWQRCDGGFAATSSSADQTASTPASAHTSTRSAGE